MLLAAAVVDRLWRARQNQSSTWLALDGPLNISWTEYFSSVLDHSKTLNIDNGDQLPLSSNVRLVFETDDLTGSSPAIVARTVSRHLPMLTLTSFSDSLIACVIVGTHI